MSTQIRKNQTKNTAVTLTDTQTLTNKTLTSPIFDGWTQYSVVTPTRTSADDPTYVLTFAGVDLTDKLSAGMKVKLTQGTDKYFFIIAISFSTDTTLTLYGGTDYDVVDTSTTAISAFYYSSMKAPFGFPLAPSKWTIEYTYTGGGITYANPAAGGVWYSNNSARMNLDVGVWDCNYRTGQLSNSRSSGSGVSQGMTLSTDGSTETHPDSSSFRGVYSDLTVSDGHSGRTIVEQTSKGYIYLMASALQQSTGALLLGCYSDAAQTLVIKAVCAYL